MKRKLRELICNILTKEKAYSLPDVCRKFGMSEGEESEAFSSKRVYVKKRLDEKSDDEILKIAVKIASEYDKFELNDLLNKIHEKIEENISLITRQKILDYLSLKGNLSGKLDLLSFLNRIWPLSEMPTNDYRFSDASGDIWQHMVNNDDWSYKELFNRLEVTDLSNKGFIRFLEEITHPLVRDNEEQLEFVNSINEFLKKDQYELRATSEISSYPVFQVIKLVEGVEGSFKNLIFAADGPKPEIVINDALNNDISIVKNIEYCLIYDKPINNGLLWSDLVNWWSSIKNLEALDIETERLLYKRLAKTLSSEAEKFFFKQYFLIMKSMPKVKLPALIPQVYLHYDPYTAKHLKNIQRLPRQRMDFLILFSGYERIVIEIDGKHHYSDQAGKANSKKYSDMVQSDRQLRLLGYELYRFGGYELLKSENREKLVKDFFTSLFNKHKVMQ